jgi:hypothetical protein
VELESTSNFEKTILDLSVKIGSLAKVEGVTTSQLEQIIASLENSPDRRNSLLICAAYTKRQANRLGRGNRTAQAIIEAIKEIYLRNGGKEEARKLLGLAKWVRESLDDIRIHQAVNNFGEYLDLLLLKR